MDHLHPVITVIGDIGVDHVMGPIDAWPRVGTELLMERSELRAGGSAGNAALALRHLGVPARLIAAVGADDFGTWLTTQFHGLQLALQQCASPTTVSVGVMHRCGERSFLTTRGHLESMGAGHVLAQLSEARPGAVALLSGAFLLPGVRAGYPALIATLSSLGHEVALDTGWPSEGWTPALRAEAMAWVAAVDHLLINELETLSLSGQAELGQAAAHLRRHMKPQARLVVKRGALGAVAWQGAQQVEVASRPAEIMDTIGAGDSFNAGYLAAHTQGAPLAEALRAGCDTAVAVLSRFPRQGLQPGELSACLRPGHQPERTVA